MTGLKPRVSRQSRHTSDVEPDTQPELEVRTYGFNTRPASPAAPSPRTEVHPIRPWESDSTTVDSVSIHRHSQAGLPAASTNWERNVVSETSIDIDSSGITHGLSHSSSVQTPNDWAPAASLHRSGQGPTSGYLGSTSFSAVFDEKIDIVAAGESNGITETQVECLSSQEHSVKIKEGAAVLAQLSDFKHFEALIERWLEYGRGLALVSSNHPCSSHRLIAFAADASNNPAAAAPALAAALTLGCD